MQHLQKRSTSQVAELQALAEEQFNRANKLSDEMTRLKSKKQVSGCEEPYWSAKKSDNQKFLLGCAVCPLSVHPYTT